VSYPYTWGGGSHSKVGGHPGDITFPIPAIRQVFDSSTQAMSVSVLAHAPSGRERSPRASTERRDCDSRQARSTQVITRAVTAAPTSAAPVGGVGHGGPPDPRRAGQEYLGPCLRLPHQHLPTGISRDGDCHPGVACLHDDDALAVARVVVAVFNLRARRPPFGTLTASGFAGPDVLGALGWWSPGRWLQVAQRRRGTSSYLSQRHSGTMQGRSPLHGCRVARCPQEQSWRRFGPGV